MNDDTIVEKPLEEATPQTEATPVEEKPVEPVAPPAEESAAQETEVPKKSAEGRIRELNAKAKASEEKAKSLEERIAELTTPVGVTGQQPTYAPQTNQDVTVDQVLSMADARAELKIRQSEAINRINGEAQQVMKAHPELDPDSDVFDKELNDAVIESIVDSIKASPYTSSPKKVVDRMMKPYRRAVTKEVAKQSETLAKQASETAMRPTSVRQNETPFDKLSIKEMEKKLGVVS